MAELHVKQKRSNLTWLWVLIILVIVAAVVYYLYTNNYFNTGEVTGMRTLKNVPFNELILPV